MATIQERQRRQLQSQRPLYERIQDWILAWDVGQSVQFFRIGMFGALMAAVILVYTGTQFYGLRDAETMNTAQLARNLALGRGYVTRVIRPLDISYLESVGKPTLSPQRMMLPELWTPPGYALVLAAPLWVVGAKTDHSNLAALRADRVVMLTGWFFFVVGLTLAYLLARELFDRRVAVLSAFLFLFCQALLDHAVSGLATGFVSVLLLVAAHGLLKAERWRRAERTDRWVNGALMVSAAAVALATLTQYAVWVVMVPLLVYAGTAFPGRRWQRVLLCVVMFALLLAPWMARNRMAARQWFGLSHYGLLEETGRGRYRSPVGRFQRMLGLESPWQWRTLGIKALENSRRLYETTIKETGANYLIAFFLVSLVHRWRDDEAVRLRWWLFWAMLGCAAWLSVTGVPQRNFFTAFVPLVVVYAAAFFIVLFERLQFRTRFLRGGMVGLFVLVNLASVVLAVLPPRETVPYPPYNSGVGAELGRMFRENELLASDIPWAMAWYGDRTTLWVPPRERDFIEINDRVRIVSGLYLTQETLQRKLVLEEWLGQEQFILRLFQPPPPAGFPLQVYRSVTPDGEQVLLSNRQR